MHTVEVKCGKPILHLPFRTLKLIAIVGIVIHVISIVYILEMFSIAVYVRKIYGQYTELLKENGNSLSLILSSAGLLTLPFDVFSIVTLLKVLKTSHRKLLGYFLLVCFILSMVLVMLLFILIIISLSMGNPSEETSMQNLIKSLGNYSDDSLTKSRIDRLQVEYQCCGARNYTDWYDINWYDKNFIRKAETPVVGEAPFSCCNIRSNSPCIHHGIEQGAGAYKYTIDANFSLSATGCYEAIQGRKLKMIWQIAGYIFCLIILQVAAFFPLRLIQTAYMERGKFDKELHLYTSWIFGCFQGKKKSVVIPPPVPPLPPELMEPTELFVCNKRL